MLLTHMRRLVVLAWLSGLLACEWGAAMSCAAATTKACDPETFEAQCLDEHSLVNCTQLVRAGGSTVGSGWHELRDVCRNGDACRLIDGFAECVAIPEEACDLGTDDRRCVRGRVQYCASLEVYRGDEYWDGQSARWVNLDETCTASPDHDPPGGR